MFRFFFFFFLAFASLIFVHGNSYCLILISLKFCSFLLCARELSCRCLIGKWHVFFSLLVEAGLECSLNISFPKSHFIETQSWFKSLNHNQLPYLHLFLFFFFFSGIEELRMIVSAQLSSICLQSLDRENLTKVHLKPANLLYRLNPTEKLCFGLRDLCPSSRHCSCLYHFEGQFSCLIFRCNALLSFNGQTSTSKFTKRFYIAF